MSSYYTENLADIMSASRERNEFRKILNAWGANGLPENFSEDNVRPAFNRNSGNVFLVNDDCQVAMLNGEKLEEFYSTPHEGHEGFLSDLTDIDSNSMHHDDAQFILDIIQAENTPDSDIPSEWQKLVYGE